MARRKSSRTGDVRGAIILNARGSSAFLRQESRLKERRGKFDINYHALGRHWRNHVSAEARATYIAGAGATKNQLEEIVATLQNIGLSLELGEGGLA
jgi:hypothetical protein